MKIESYNINISSNNFYKKEVKEKENEKFWLESNENTEKTLNEFFKEKIKDLIIPVNLNSFGIEEISEEENLLDSNEKFKLKLLQEMLERISGKKIDVSFIEDIENLKKRIKNHGNNLNLYNSNGNVETPLQGWGYEYNYSKTEYEFEKTEFNATGIVKTSDGKEINIDISLSLQRELFNYESFSVKMGDALIDPLVINFDGTSAELSEKKFHFDLTFDGNMEYISSLNPGSGFLAVDWNNDGVINDGKELFGPQSGNGFKELAKYDSDGNGWIDENDEIFNKLKIWTFDENGNSKLFSLIDKNIGAIYLGNVDTNFRLIGAENNLNGMIQKTGIYLKENGTAGLIQHIDLSV
jgi:hypothetical protein